MGTSLCATLGFTFVLANTTDETYRTKLSWSKQSFQAPGRLRKRPMKVSSHPLVVFFEQGTEIYAPQHRMLQDDETLHAPAGEEAARNRHVDDPQDGCIPMADWQSKSFPNCNSIHELDLRAAGPNAGVDETVGFEDNLAFLGQGWFRHAWQLDHGVLGESVVLKTLRLERDYLEEYYDLHRRDALAMERLTHSPFVMDVYGFCGQSAINELADFPYGLNSLEKFDRHWRDHHGPDVLLLKLQVAASVALGLAHVHEIDSDEVATMVHYDLNPRNVAITKNGIPKLNDFNIGVFLRVNPETNKTCGFPSRLHEPWWRAPEEVEIGNNNSLSEKVDVYALGNLLFHILTTKSPRGKMYAERMQETRELVLRGEAPILPEPFDRNNDSVTKVFRKAMEMCFEVDPAKRASARQIANMLMTTLKEAKAKAKKKREEKRPW